MWFNVYLAFLQYLQFTYQRGVLYRLRSLGERNDMDITIDGFHSWMWKGNLNVDIVKVDPQAFQKNQKRHFFRDIQKSFQEVTPIGPEPHQFFSF